MGLAIALSELVFRGRQDACPTRIMPDVIMLESKGAIDHPVALRLKELEVLERIAEKIDRIQVNGSLDSILTETN